APGRPAYMPAIPACRARGVPPPPVPIRRRCRFDSAPGKCTATGRVLGECDTTRSVKYGTSSGGDSSPKRGEKPILASPIRATFRALLSRRDDRLDDRLAQGTFHRTVTRFTTSKCVIGQSFLWLLLRNRHCRGLSSP